MIMSCRGALPEGVYVTLHVADAVLPDNAHVPANVPVPLVLRLTLPVGVTKLPAELSATVTLHVDEVPMVTGVVQLTVEVVVRLLTVTLVAPLLGW